MIKLVESDGLRVEGGDLRAAKQELNREWTRWISLDAYGGCPTCPSLSHLNRGFVPPRKSLQSRGVPP
jgi:hypothetical protein